MTFAPELVILKVAVPAPSSVVPTSQAVSLALTTIGPPVAAASPLSESEQAARPAVASTPAAASAKNWVVRI